MQLMFKRPCKFNRNSWKKQFTDAGEQIKQIAEGARTQNQITR
jgi:hypothetical protein